MIVFEHVRHKMCCKHTHIFDLVCLIDCSSHEKVHGVCIYIIQKLEIGFLIRSSENAQLMGVTK